MKSCIVENCVRKYYSRGYCRKHYDKVRNHGSVEKRTRKDPNEIVVYDKYAEIILYSNNEVCATTKIDLEDVEKVKNYKWYKRSDGYISAEKVRTSNKATKLHRFIMDYPDNMIDHIDRDKLNNRKDNLRIIDSIGNNRNKGIQRNNTSGVVGVYWNKQHKKWNARITVNKKAIFLGLFTDLTKAKTVRVNAERKYFGEFRSSINGE